MLIWMENNIVGIIGLIISIISSIIAYKQANEKKILKNMYLSNSWILYQRINNLSGTIQKALIDSNNLEIDKGLYEKIVRSDALSAELLKEGIRLILLSDESITNETIDSWVENKRITEMGSDLFRKYCVAKANDKKVIKN
ncbi:hypothetical protein [Clostridium cochlearium]|uniref:hypothetical protein n=1 Tax=Clostridium cochlearium TaxID=1494 RepID=UPI0022E616E2|nr:hypothetical protein [Clostridium cochlearium]